MGVRAGQTARDHPLSLLAFSPESVLSFIMPAWLLWSIFAAILVLPVLFRYAEDRVSGNEITQEQGDDPEDGRGHRDDDPDGLLAAALGFRP